MESNFNIGSEGNVNYNRPQAEEGLINKTLPQEIFEVVLAHLDEMELHQANQVSHLWSKEALSIAKKLEFMKIQSFCKFLAEHEVLQKEDYADQKAELLALGSDRKILDSINLIQIKLSIHELKERILEILKDCRVDDLGLLEKLTLDMPKPSYFNHIFFSAQRLSIIYKDLEGLDKKSNDWWRMHITDVYDCIKQLIQIGAIDKAINSAKIMPEDFYKDETLVELCIALVRMGKIDQAIKIAEEIDEVTKKEFIFEYISSELKFMGENEKSKELEISDLADRDLALGKVAEKLAKMKEFNRAIEVANWIADTITKEETLSDIAIRLAKMDDEATTKKAIEIAKSMTDIPTKDQTLVEICLALASRKEYDRATEFADLITSEERQGYVLIYIEEYKKQF